MAITWIETQRDELNKRMREAAIRPDSCVATKIESLWQSRHSDILGVALRDIYEAAGFTDIELDVRQADNGEQYTVIRFRLPHATEAAPPAPRYYVERICTYLVKDRLSNDEMGHVCAFAGQAEAEAEAAELNEARDFTGLDDEELKELWGAAFAYSDEQVAIGQELKSRGLLFDTHYNDFVSQEEWGNRYGDFPDYESKANYLNSLGDTHD